MVAAAALLAEGSEQRGDVSQDAAAVLYQEVDQLTHLHRETPDHEVRHVLSYIHLKVG